MSTPKILLEGLTYDDVLLIPRYSEILPREVNIQTKFTKNITINCPIISAAMDTVTESDMAIAMAREGGIGVLHKNMSIDRQAAEVKKVKRSESGLIIDPITLTKDKKVAHAKSLMKKYRIVERVYSDGHYFYVQSKSFWDFNWFDEIKYDRWDNERKHLFTSTILFDSEKKAKKYIDTCKCKDLKDIAKRKLDKTRVVWSD